MILNISKSPSEQLYLYVVQSGLYETLDLLISSVKIKNSWYSLAAEGDLKDLLYYAYEVFFDDFRTVRFEEENLTFCLDDILRMSPEKFIK